jgi:hypothetical protein
MSANAEAEKLPMLVAEEVLRTIYGDDFQGCKTNPEVIAVIIREAISPILAKDQGFFDLYEKVLQAIQLLSTPPDISKVNTPEALRSLLSERLDAIHAITKETLAATNRLKA